MDKQEKYFRLPLKLWDEGWDEPTMLLAIYLFLNRHRTSEGLYRLSKAEVCDELHWSTRRLRRPWQVLLDAGFIEYDDERQVVFLRWAMRVQSNNPNTAKHAIRMLRQLPNTPLLAKLYELAIGPDPVLAKAMEDELWDMMYPRRPRPRRSESPSRVRDPKTGESEAGKGETLQPAGTSSEGTLGNHALGNPKPALGHHSPLAGNHGAEKGEEHRSSEKDGLPY